MEGLTIQVNQGQMNQSIQLEEAIKREKGRLLNFIKKTVGKTEDAEDITQDVFLQLTKAFNEAQSPSELCAINEPPAPN